MEIYSNSSFYNKKKRLIEKLDFKIQSMQNGKALLWGCAVYQNSL